MFPNKDDEKIQEAMKGMLSELPRRTMPEARKKEFIARLYKVSEERKSIVDFVPVRSTRIFATVTAALFVCVITYHHLFLPIAPYVTNISGTVKVYSASHNEWRMVDGEKRVRLAKHDILKTFDDGQADLVIPKLYHMRVKRKTEVRLARSTSRAFSGDIQYDVSQGKVFTYYDKERKIGKQFNIKTEEALVSALGTDFMVDVVPNKTWVGVLDGMVNVRGLEATQVSVKVAAGQKTVIQKGKAPARPERMLENELLDLGELYRIGMKPQVALLISTGRTRTRELLAATPLYVVSDKSDILPAQMAAIVRKFNQALKTHSKDVYIENIKQFEDLLAKYPNPKYDVQFSLFIAAYYEHLGEHDKAIEAFRKVVEGYPQSSLASVAQCAIGIIYEEELKDPAQAKSAYEQVIKNYPDSPEAEEARAGLDRLPR